MKSGMKRVLNVAEKPSIAKSIALYLSDGNSRNEQSYSKFNPIYHFTRDFQGSKDCEIKVTSVTGHIQEIHFHERYKNWSTNDPLVLIQSAEILKRYDEGKTAIVQNLTKLSQGSTDIVLWLDCDREGEAIAYEVLDICLASRANLTIHRAHFSATTRNDIIFAFENLRKPNKLLADVNSLLKRAVNARQEIDLRIGAAFTRLQTLAMRNRFEQSDFGKVVR
jgi:DNA topoisomerase-3